MHVLILIYLVILLRNLEEKEREMLQINLIKKKYQ